MPWSSIPFCCEGFEEEADQEEAKGWLVPLRVLEPSILFIHHYNRKIALLFTSLDLCSIKCMYIYIYRHRRHRCITAPLYLLVARCCSPGWPEEHTTLAGEKGEPSLSWEGIGFVVNGPERLFSCASWTYSNSMFCSTTRSWIWVRSWVYHLAHSLEPKSSCLWPCCLVRIAEIHPIHSNHNETMLVFVGNHDRAAFEIS